jgi:hypothetical protein
MAPERRGRSETQRHQVNHPEAVQTRNADEASAKALQSLTGTMLQSYGTRSLAYSGGPIHIADVVRRHGHPEWCRIEMTNRPLGRARAQHDQDRRKVMDNCVEPVNAVQSKDHPTRHPSRWQGWCRYLATGCVMMLSLVGVAYGGSQQGGVPALDGRVTALEALVATLQTSASNQSQQIAALQNQVTTLQGQTALQGSQIAALQTSVAGLQTALANAQATLGCMSKVGNDVIFEGCNVHVRSGSGSTNGTVNGLGNLIIGYSETFGPVDRSGSHNLVVGRYHSYSSWGGFVAGELNSVSAPAASVSGGFQNTASGLWSVVSGGGENMASADRSTVSGGVFNNATDGAATVSGGGFNTASKLYATVSGGYANQASGSAATVSGGAQRTAPGDDNWVAGALFQPF